MSTIYISRFLLPLSQGISSGCHHATPSPKFFLEVSLLGKGGIVLLLRLSQSISSWFHYDTPTPKSFRSFIIVGRGIMLLLRLSQGISSGCHYTTPTHNFLLFIILGRGIILLLPLSQGIYSGCHHTTPTPKCFFANSLLWEGALCFCFDLASFNLRVPPCHPYTQFLGICHYCGMGNLLLLRFSQGVSTGCHHATPTT